MMAKKRIYIIVGPTASGKTALSIACARAMDAEIISADSMQIYTEMNIGTAKPTVPEMNGVTHHLLDFVPPSDGTFHVTKFRAAAERCIEEIYAKGKKPLIVGGTGLYINSLIFPLGFTEVEPNDELRAELNALEASQPGILHGRLREVDPVTADRLHPNDTKRLVRALEVFVQTGRPLSAFGNDFANTQNNECPYDASIIGITMPRELLYERINKRVDRMLENGLLNEVDRLIGKGYDPALPAMQGIGYKQLIAYRNGIYSHDEAIETIKRETRRYAKRQITWFKRDKRIRWIDAAEFTDPVKMQEHAIKLLTESEKRE